MKRNSKKVNQPVCWTSESTSLHHPSSSSITLAGIVLDDVGDPRLLRRVLVVQCRPRIPAANPVQDFQERAKNKMGSNN